MVCRNGRLLSGLFSTENLVVFFFFFLKRTKGPAGFDALNFFNLG